MHFVYIVILKKIRKRATRFLYINFLLSVSVDDERFDAFGSKKNSLFIDNCLCISADGDATRTRACRHTGCPAASPDASSIARRRISSQTSRWDFARLPYFLEILNITCIFVKLRGKTFCRGRKKSRFISFNFFRPTVPCGTLFIAIRRIGRRRVSSCKSARGATGEGCHWACIPGHPVHKRQDSPVSRTRRCSISNLNQQTFKYFTLARPKSAVGLGRCSDIRRKRKMEKIRLATRIVGGA